MNMHSGVIHLVLNMWITKPFESDTVDWTLVTKETETYVVHYYSMSERRVLSDINSPRTEYIGDLLWLKVHDGGVINADRAGVQSVLRDVMSLIWRCMLVQMGGQMAT